MSYDAILALNNTPDRYRLVPTYTDANAAFAAAPDNALVLVTPGTYPVTTALNLDRKLAVFGDGGLPEFTGLNNTFNIVAGADLTLDRVSLAGGSAFYTGALSLPDRYAQLIANRSLLQTTAIQLTGVVLGGTLRHFPGCFEFRHCSLVRPAQGNTTFWSTNLSNVALHRCYTPNYETTFASGSLHEDDKVLTPTTDYGHEYGDAIIDPSPLFADIASRVLDLRSVGSPRVVLFDWADPSTFATPAQIDSEGHWSGAMVPHGVEFGVYYLSRDGRCPPIIHGPYTAE
jgi:hypothetical protein